MCRPEDVTRTVLGSGRSSKHIQVSRCFHAEAPVVFSQVLGSGAAIRPSMVQECTSRFFSTMGSSSPDASSWKELLVN